MFSTKFRVRFSEVGADGRLKLSALVDYLQDCAIFHGEDIGYGIRIYEDERKAWLLISWHIIIHELPRLGEELEVVTIPYAFNRCLGMRGFRVIGAKGEEYVLANSQWAYVDVDNQRPTRPPVEMVEAYMSDASFEMPQVSRKMFLPAKDDENTTWTTKEAITVRREHLDTNHHVNNGQYVHMAFQFLEEEDQVTEIRVEYKKQAHLGDQITPIVGRVQDGRIYIELTDESGAAYTTFGFTERGKATI